MDLHEIFWEGWEWASEQMGNFGGDPDHRLDIWIVFRIRRYWETGSGTNINLLLILIPQMAALVRRALEEVLLSQCL